MTKIEARALEVEKLTPEELSAFRRWLVEYDWKAWDREIEQDGATGKLDQIVAEALQEYKRSETRDWSRHRVSHRLRIDVH